MDQMVKQRGRGRDHQMCLVLENEHWTPLITDKWEHVQWLIRKGERELERIKRSTIKKNYKFDMNNFNWRNGIETKFSLSFSSKVALWEFFESLKFRWMELTFHEMAPPITKDYRTSSSHKSSVDATSFLYSFFF